MIRRRSGTRQVDWGDPAPQQQDDGAAVRVPALGEAGPSDYASRWMDSVVTPAQEVDEEDAIGGSEGAISRRSARRRAHRSPRSAMALVPACLASLLPTTAAAPPRKRRDSRRSPPSQPLPPPKLLPTPTAPPVRRDDAPHYLDPYLEPSTLPSVRHLVEENRLPYVLTQGDDGQWSKVDYGWSIFGRQAGPTNAVLVNNAGETVASVPSSTWAVEENLPTGWGQSSNRTDFYKVPLIAVASVILAIGLVTIIFIIAFKRRKAVRRAKRRAERQRRKALAAAGLTENDINESNANAAMAEKLQALEEKHRNGKRRKFGSTALVRTKVKNWNQGLRRRKGRKADADQDGVGHMEVVHEDTGDEDQDKPVEPATGPQVLNHDRSSEDSAGSATDPPSESSGSRSGSHNDSSPTTSTSSGEALQPAPEDDTTPTAYFPPAYRPASVRSMRLTTSAGSSSLSSSMHDGPPPTVLEKTNAPGYYPAPTTVDTEEALAVVSRSQGKSRAIVDEEEEARAERMRHVATDDKRVLEQLRLGASAPSAPPPAEVNEAGPSAPMFDVDEHGFERITLEEAGPCAPPEPVVSPQASSAPGSLPAPPRRIMQRSLRPTADVDEQFSRDVAMVVPSAPPVLEADYAVPDNTAGSAPSAPPMLDDEDGDVPEDTASTVPSAPPLALDDDDADESAGPDARTSTESRRASPVGSTQSTRTASHAHDPTAAGDGAGDEGDEDVEMQRTQRESSRSSAHPGVVFLPRYEP